MEKLIKIISSPFNPNLEMIDDISIKLHVPYSEHDVTIQICPNIEYYSANEDQINAKVRQVMVSTNTEQTSTIKLDFDKNNTEKFIINNKEYEIKLMQIGKERLQGQDFPFFEFLVRQ